MNSKQQEILDKLIKNEDFSNVANDKNVVANVKHGKTKTPLADSFCRGLHKKEPKFNPGNITKGKEYYEELAKALNSKAKDRQSSIDYAVRRFNYYLEVRKVKDLLAKDTMNPTKFFVQNIMQKFSNIPGYKWNSTTYQLEKDGVKSDVAANVNNENNVENNNKESNVNDEKESSEPQKTISFSTPDQTVSESEVLSVPENKYVPKSFQDVKDNLSKINDVDEETKIMMLSANDSYLKNNNINDEDYEDVKKANDKLMKSTIWECNSDEFKTLASKYINGDISSKTLAKTVVPSPTPELKKMLEKELKKETKKEGDLDIDDLKTDKPLEKKDLETPKDEPPKRLFTKIGQITPFIRAGQGKSSDIQYLSDLNEALEFCEKWGKKYNKKNNANENRIKRLKDRISTVEGKIGKNQSLQSQLSVSRVEEPKEPPKPVVNVQKAIEDIKSDLRSKIIFHLSYWNNPEIIADAIETRKDTKGRTIQIDNLEKRRRYLIRPCISEAVQKLRKLKKSGQLTESEFVHEKQKLVDDLNDDFFPKDNEYGIRLNSEDANGSYIRIKNIQAVKDERRAEKGYVNQNSPNKFTFFQYNMKDIYDIIEDFVSESDADKFKLSQHAKDEIQAIIENCVEKYKQKAEDSGYVQHNTVTHGKSDELLIKLIEKYINRRKNIHIKLKFELPSDARTKIIEIVKREETRYKNKILDTESENKQKSKNLLSKINNLFFRR